MGLLRRAGTLLIVGVPPRPGSINLPLVQDWEIRVQGCAAYTESDVETSIRVAAAGGLPTGEIVSGTYPLDDLAAAFERAAADSSGKVMVAPSR
jgi:threonine dehydrogenase-like Zn-dependent dehydrogenase